MRHERLHALTDGIFAIVMTLLVLEIKVPEIHGEVSNAALWDAFSHNGIVFLSYILSFTVLYTYWRAHTFVISIVAQSLNIWLVNLNALFLFFVTALPFSAHVLGLYNTTELGVSVYAVNIILIGLSLYGMRRYVETSDKIESKPVNAVETRNVKVRMLLPVCAALLAIAFSFVTPAFAITFLVIAAMFNLLPNDSRLTLGLLKKN